MKRIERMLRRLEERAPQPYVPLMPLLPTKPMIGEAVIDRSGGRPYAGPIDVGVVFAWEPDLPYSRELCLVTRVDGERVWTEPLDGGKEVWNDLSRFREAVVPTIFNKMVPASRGDMSPRWPLSLFEKHSQTCRRRRLHAAMQGATSCDTSR